MNYRGFLTIAFIIPFLFSTLSHAHNDFIAEWTQKTLVGSLSINYKNNKALYNKMRPNYTLNTWEALGDFLGNYVEMVKKNKLTLHPRVVEQATVIKSGFIQNSNFFAGLYYWKVQQVIEIPELNITIDFLATVVGWGDGKYIIESLNMTLHGE